MKTVLYIVARLNSSRIPKKNIMPLHGIPMLLRTYDQVKKIKGVDEIKLATTTSHLDDELVEIAEENNLDVVRGHEDFVLDRIYHAALDDEADNIIYVGGDGPLIDPYIYSEALELFLDKKINFLTSYEPQTFPGGYDFNIIDFESLKIAYDKALAPSQRINMFSYFTFNESSIKKYNFEYKKNLSNFHLSLDNPEDIVFFELIFEEIDKKDIKINLKNTIKLIKEHKELYKIAKSLFKPKASNALFNSTHILKGLFKDIEFLLEKALIEDNKLLKEDYISQAFRIAKIISS